MYVKFKFPHFQNCAFKKVMQPKGCRQYAQKCLGKQAFQDSFVHIALVASATRPFAYISENVAA